MRRTKTMLIMGVTMVGLLGCENPTLSGDHGEVEVGVTGSGAGEASAAPMTSGVASSGEGSVSGSVDVRARVWVRAEGRHWVEVTRGYTEQRVDVRGGDGLKLLARAELEAGGYDRVRVEFERVDAWVEGGLAIGVGLLTGEVRVASGANGRIVVEREVPLRVRARSRAQLGVALNAEHWLRHADAQTRTVAEADFRSAVQVLAY
jgi:hypothetical protein